MTKTIKIIDNQTIEIKNYRNPNVCFDIREITTPYIDDYDWYCDFSATINPFQLYSDYQKSELKIKELNKIIERLEKYLLDIYISTGYEELYKIGIKDSYDKLQELKEEGKK